MAVRSVLKMGDPLLLQRAAEVERFDVPELHALIQDMHDTMDAMDGAGIAAPANWREPARGDFRCWQESALSRCRAGALYRAYQSDCYASGG